MRKKHTHLSNTLYLIILIFLLSGLIGCSTPLIKAVQKGDISSIKSLLDNGADINQQASWFEYTTPLSSAAYRGQTEIVRLLLSQGADPDGGESSPLYWAAFQGHTETVRFLLDHGADPDGTTSYMTPIVGAATKGNTDIVKLLIQAGANINSTGGFFDGGIDILAGANVLDRAASQGHTSTVRTLLDAGAEINEKFLESIRFLRKVNPPSEKNETAFEHCIKMIEKEQQSRLDTQSTVALLPQNSFVAESPSAAPLHPAETYPLDPENIDFGNYYALVIGNNNYQHVTRLNTAVNDAKSIGLMLQNDYGFKVKLIADGTRSNILQALDAYRAQLTKNDNLLIYYAGHGYYDKDAERGYWLPVDAQTTTRANWISNVDVTDTLKAAQAKHVMIVADSCYSGTLTRAVHVTLRNPTWLSRISQKKSRTVLTSGGNEPVADSGGGAHSVFANAFLKALQENTGVMDGTVLFSKIRRPIMLNSDQTPQYSDIRKAGHDGGDFLFVKTR